MYGIVLVLSCLQVDPFRDLLALSRSSKINFDRIYGGGGYYCDFGTMWPKTEEFFVPSWLFC